MDNYTEGIMSIITAISRYIDKYSNREIIEKYYEINKTYKGIDTYLYNIEKNDINNNNK